MNPKRKQVQDQIIHEITLLAQGDPRNAEMYRKKFDAMSDADYEAFIEELRGGKFLCFMKFPDMPTFTAKKMTELARKFGRKMYCHLIYPATAALPSRKSPARFSVRPAIVRRQRQIGSHKNSVAKTTAATNLLTGQAAGSAAAGRLSGPEFGIHRSNGLNEALLELTSIRGGDVGAYRAMQALYVQNGEVSIKEIGPHATGSEATSTMHQLLLGMHIKTNLADK